MNFKAVLRRLALLFLLPFAGTASFNDSSQSYLDKVEMLEQQIARGSEEDIMLLLKYIRKDVFLHSLRLMQVLVKKGGTRVQIYLAQKIFPELAPSYRRELMRMMTEWYDQKVLWNLARLFSLADLPSMEGHPETMHLMVERMPWKIVFHFIAEELSRLSWIDFPETVESAVLKTKGESDSLSMLDDNIFVEEHWQNHPRWREIVGARGKITAGKLYNFLAGERGGCHR